MRLISLTAPNLYELRYDRLRKPTHQLNSVGVEKGVDNRMIAMPTVTKHHAESFFVRLILSTAST